MITRRSGDLPLAVQMPAPDADKPSWVKVGVIAAVGFVVGVGWPKLAGIRLGPSAPAEATAATSAAAQAETPLAAPLVTASAPSVAPVAVTRPPALAAAPAPVVVPPSVVVGHGAVLTCKTESGEALKGAAACGALGGFDAVARPRLAKLASCPAASGATGKLSALFSLDFKTNHVGVDVGKSSTLSSSDGMGACLKSSFQGVSLGPIQHDNVKYAVAYSIMFSAPTGGAAPPADLPPPSLGGSPAPADPRAAVPPSSAASIAAPSAAEEGSAQVVWEVALVRDSPRTGQVVARLARGTKVRLMNGEEGWYKVQFGPAFSTEGYVYRGAIGK